MQTLDPPRGSAPLAVAPRKAEIVLAETNRLRLELLVPLLEEIKDIEQYDQTHASLTETSLERQDLKKSCFRRELEHFVRKEGKFGQLPTFLTRAANLAGRSGDLELEAIYLRRAQLISDDSFIRSRIADTLIALGELGEAREVLTWNGNDGQSDAGVVLRLAALKVLQSDYESAADIVEDAVRIDLTNPAVRLFQGGLALYLGNFRKAVRAFRVAAERRPNSSVLHANLALAYLRLGEVDKAFESLHSAVAFGPLNVNAVSILADLAFEHDRNEVAIASLRYLTTCEQKNAEIWSRLARACLQVGEYAEAIAALKHQASIESSSRVWNNLGVAYLKSQRREKAVAAFALAMELGVENPDRGYFLAARNTAQLLAHADRDKDLLRFTSEILKKDTRGLCLKDKALADVYAFQLYALRRAGLASEHRRVAMWLIANPYAVERIRMWAMGVVVSHSALCQDPFALRLIEEHEGWLRSIPKLPSGEYTLLFNNVAFALAELGHTREAREFLGRIIDKVGREPYPTATKGLIAIREGKFERGIKDYEKAISLAVGRHHKTRIKQKLYLEKARRLIDVDFNQAKKFLQRIIKMQPGEELLVKQAKELMQRITHQRRVRYAKQS